MKAAAVVLLQLFFAALLLASSASADLPRTTRITVTDGEFVTLHVGYPGEDVAFHVRWNLASVALLRPVRSRTYDTVHGTDLVFFGQSALRIPIDYASAEPPGVNSPQLELRGYTGLLGLAPGSPIYAYFPWVRYTEHTLELCAHAPHAPHDAVFPGADGAFNVLLDRAAASLRVSMMIDNSMVPWTYSDKHWTLDLFQQSDNVVTTSARRRAVRVKIDSHYEHVFAVDSSRVTIIRPMAGNVTDALLLGRLMVQRLFTVALDASGDLMWLEPDCVHHTRVALLDYAPLLLALLFVHGLWALGLGEDVNAAESLARLDVAEPPSTLVIPLHQMLYTVSSAVFRRPSLPPDVGRSWQPQSLIAFRSVDFVRALAWLTTLVCVVTALFATFGARLGSAITPSFNSVQDAIAVYSTCGVLLVMCAGAHAASTQPNTGVAYGSSAALLAIWLVALICSRDIVIVIALLISSAIVSIQLMRLTLGSVFGTLWPAETYGRWSASGRGGSSRRLYLFWLALNGTLAVWAAWLAAFYTLPLVLRDWRPAHPLSYGVGALGFLVCAICAMSTYYSRQILYAKMSTAGVSRTKLYAALFHENSESVAGAGAHRP